MLRTLLLLLLSELTTTAVYEFANWDVILPEREHVQIYSCTRLPSSHCNSSHTILTRTDVGVHPYTADMTT